LRFVDPTRAHRPSATAVFACSIVPFHSNTRTPSESRGRYAERDSGDTSGMSLAPGREVVVDAVACAAQSA